MARIEDGEARRVEFPVAMVVTDERFVFVPAGSQTREAGVLDYGDVVAVEVGETLELRTVDGVTWRLPVADASDAVAGHLRWVGSIRSRVVATGNDVDLAAGQIRENAADRDWEGARETYERCREQVDEVVDAVQRAPVADGVLAPEVTGIERTLEYAYARACVGRAESRLELGRQLVGNGSYDQAGTVLASAQEYHDRARSRTEEVKRGDSFRFGEQRELEDDLERLAWEIETTAAEPVRQAHEASLRAREADDPAVAVERWQEALDRYRAVRSLERVDSDWRFAGDKARVGEELRAAANHLVDGHLELARKRWNAGVEDEAAGEIKAAIRLCNDASDHVERATELAAAFRSEGVDRLRRRRDRMADAIQRLRVTATVQRERIHASEVEADDEAATAEEIADIDTHHEIGYDLDEVDTNGSEDSAENGHPEVLDLGGETRRRPGS